MGPLWVLKCDRGAGAEAGGWSVSVSHLSGGEKYIMVYVDNLIEYQLTMDKGFTTEYMSFRPHCI